ncbi:hypothetical protein L6R52_38390, partial [Myxococcota bacterium]|nr:hypothetical protein [Myxococcota bacterium]
MENWQLALVIIAAIFAGVAIPMIIQYQTTLRSIDRLVRNSEGDVRRTLYELAQLAGHLNRISAAVDGNTKHLRTAFETFDELADGVRRMRGSMKTASIVGAAVAPALSAVIRALQGG